MTARAITPQNRGFTIANAGTTDLDKMLGAIGAALADTLGFPQAEGVVVVDASGPTDLDRGTALLAAYAAAKILTPGGNALSQGNRATVIVPPGRYDLGTGTTQTPAGGIPEDNHGLILDTEFVDLVGVDPDRNNTLITSQIVTASRGTIEQTANDVRIRNLTIEDSGVSGMPNFDGTDPAAYWPNCSQSDPAGTGLMTVCENVLFRAAYSNTMRIGPTTYAGRFTDCISVGTGSGFGSSGATASGIFTNCDDVSFNGGFGGGGGTASGTFTNCTGGYGSFGGGGGTASGTFTNCTGGYDSFGGGGGTASGTFTNCTGGDGSFGGYGGTASGTFTNCTGGNGSFGGYGGTDLGGQFVRCAGGSSSFVSYGSYFDCSVAGVHITDTVPSP